MRRVIYTMNKILELKKVADFAKPYLKKADAIHGLKHIEMVVRYSSIIAEKEGADKRLCLIAAYLHDIKRSKKWIKETKNNNHGIKSAKIAERFLISNGLKRSEVKEICKAISLHCFPKTQKILISKILWDADKLGLFSKEMEKDHCSYWRIKLGNKDRAIKKLQETRKFYIKYFHTKTAKEIVAAMIKKRE